MFTLALSCLTTSNLPWFMDLIFQVPMQYCSLQHRTLLLSPVTSTTGYCFCFGSIPLFFVELFLHWSPVAYWRVYNSIANTSKRVLFLPTSDVYVRSFLYLLYILIKLYYTKALSDQASSLAPDWILLLWRPRVPVSLHHSATTFHSHINLHRELFRACIVLHLYFVQILFNRTQRSDGT